MLYDGKLSEDLEILKRIIPVVPEETATQSITETKEPATVGPSLLEGRDVRRVIGVNLLAEDPSKKKDQSLVQK